jgi:SanA protein
MRAMRPRRKPQHEAKPAEKLPVGKPAPASALSATETDEELPRDGLADRLRGEIVWFDRFLRRWLVRLMVFGTHLTIALVACYFIVWTVARGRSYDSVEQTPQRLCGLVLGTVPKVAGRDNVFFTSRIQAAADLYKAGKLRYLIVSGDNSHNGYDEPSEMKAALIAKGVPASHVYCDYAGLRTLDSIVRTDRIFGQQQFTIISQAFHNPRALYIARRKGLVDCIAFNAPGVDTSSTIWMHLRELLVRVRAILDVEFLKTSPKLLGDKIEIGEMHPPIDAKPLQGS